MDGLINIYDTTIEDEDDALLHIINHGSSISHAGFLSEKEIYALSHDESLTVQSLDDPDGEESAASTADHHHPRTIFGDLRPILKCEYIVNVLPLSRSKNNGAIVGAGSHRFVCLAIDQFWQKGKLKPVVVVIPPTNTSISSP